MSQIISHHLSTSFLEVDSYSRDLCIFSPRRLRIYIHICGFRERALVYSELESYQTSLHFKVEINLFLLFFPLFVAVYLLLSG